MQRLLLWLNRPYPFEVRWLSGIRNGLWVGIFVTLFLFLVRPFGTNIAPDKLGLFLLVCCGFGMVTFVVTVLTNGLCLLFPGVFFEERWTVWKEILLNLAFIFLIGFANLVFAHFLWNVPISGINFWRWQGFTLTIGFFPTLFGAFMTQMRLSHRYAGQAAGFHPHPQEAQDELPLKLEGDNQNESLLLKENQIVYLTSKDNYVQVFYLEKEVMKNRLLRATLRKMEEVLLQRSVFMRCHRAFIVNLDKVEKISGNAQGYRLHLPGIADTIPVSRAMNEEIRQKLDF